MRHLQFNKHFKNLENIACEDFWATISKITRAGSDVAFPTLSQFVFNLMCLPGSSANVERIFSKVNLYKTKYRNRLDNTTLEGILFTHDYLIINKCSCYNLKIERNLITNCKPSQYYSNVN